MFWLCADRYLNSTIELVLLDGFLIAKRIFNCALDPLTSGMLDSGKIVSKALKRACFREFGLCKGCFMALHIMFACRVFEGLPASSL